MNALEFVSLALPFAADLDSDLDATINFFSAALVVDTKLNNVSIVQLLRTRLHVGGRKPGVVEECTRGGTGVPY